MGERRQINYTSYHSSSLPHCVSISHYSCLSFVLGQVSISITITLDKIKYTFENVHIYNDVM